MSVLPLRSESMFDTVIDPLVDAGVGEPAGMRQLDPSALVKAVVSSHRLESMLVARRLAAVAALLARRVAAAEQADSRPGYAVIDGFEQTTAEVAAAMNLSPMAASYLVSLLRPSMSDCLEWRLSWPKAEPTGAPCG